MKDSAMTPNDPHLLELFWGLQKAGLSLRIEDYQLLCQAWDKGFRPDNYQQLRQLCRRLWVKSLADKQCFENYFEQYLQQWLTQPEKESSPPNPSPTPTGNTETPTPQETTTTPTEPAPLPPTETNITLPEETEELTVGKAVSQPQGVKEPIRFTLSDEFFPLTRRQMQQGWRKLRQLIREGSATELDISATLKRISQEGFFLEPVLIPSRVNQTQLLLLIDQSNSMIPFAPLAERLIETAYREGGLGETKTFYFRNIPKDFLYSDLDLLQKQALTDIIPHLHKNRTIVLILSDSGAARGGLNQNRVELTEQFLSEIKPKVRQVGWLNPLPASRWHHTTASQAAKLVSMYPFDVAGWRRMIEEMRRRQTPVKEYEYSANDSKSTQNQQLVQQVHTLLQQLKPTYTRSKESKEFIRYESAALTIADFALWGQAYLDLACHAAFPLALTPDLLYYLRENFPYDQQDKWLNIPWLAVPDILLSNLCHPAGHPLYEMDSAVRHLLLKLLQTNERFGNQRLEQLSKCMIFYLQQKLQNPNLDIKDFGEKPEWIALAYTQPNQVARELAQMLKQIYSSDKADEKIRTASLTATFVEPLAEAGFQPLLTFAYALGRQARGYTQGAQELFEQLPKQSIELDIEGIKLRIPGRTTLPSFSFDVVTLNATGQIINRERRQAQYFTETLPDGVTLEMVSIPGGTFQMGAPETEKESNDDERPQHQVTVPPFFMGKYLVTQKQWRAVASLERVNRELNPNPSRFKGDNLPVENIFWFDCVEFCARLSAYTKRDYRLPSEAEWEYACRARTTTPFHFGETISTEVANYDGNYTYGSGSKGRDRKKTTPVGSFQVANAFGLFDMHGNIWEWCADEYHKNYQGAPVDGSAWVRKKNENDNQAKVLRGGSWINDPRGCRSAARVDDSPDNRDHGDGVRGFRVVVSG
jgi:formylglycine-generating enzyme required for sulfatase activity/uncharacterized protein with von Willebrand factor type A (vWA) domain